MLPNMGQLVHGSDLGWFLRPSGPSTQITSYHTRKIYNARQDEESR